jgi:hypothetical protein
MIAYKFLRAGAVGPFSGHQWRTGTWVRADGAPEECRRGVHACRTQDLPWWLAAELYEIELDGEVVALEHKVVAPAGRLTRRIDAWTTDLANEYAEACAWRARDRAAEALRLAGDADAAATVSAATTLEELEPLARELAASVPGARVSLMIAGDGAIRAITRAVATSAYIAAHAARRVGGAAAIDAEREWQAEWLVERLGLRTVS